MSKFERSFNNDLVQKLRSESLFVNCLLPDIKKGLVFPAIRRQRMDFYHHGGKLFSYDKNGFYTHVKYASVLELEGNGDYVYSKNYTQGRERKVSIPASFEDAYEGIKENCAVFAGKEGAELSKLLHNYSFASSTNSDVIVIDLEVQFTRDPSDDVEIPSGSVKKRSQERIDMLLFKKSTGQLRFIEAKHFSNQETRSKTQKNLSVWKQMNGYNKQVEKREDEIVGAYNKQRIIMNEIFRTSLPEVKGVDTNVGLIIYGFDSPQRQAFKNMFLGSDSEHGYGNIYEGIHLYMVGGPNNLDANTIWNRTKSAKK
ncbi:hypothetical protein K8I28_01840 [bacterium]|nr:hypothetical protein [bacterium]